MVEVASPLASATATVMYSTIAACVEEMEVLALRFSGAPMPQPATAARGGVCHMLGSAGAMRCVCPSGYPDKRWTSRPKRIASDFPFEASDVCF